MRLRVSSLSHSLSHSLTSQEALSSPTVLQTTAVAIRDIGDLQNVADESEE
jgi:hypothetical protein